MSIAPSTPKQEYGREATINFSQIKSDSNKDLLDDIKLVLSNLRKAGLQRAIIVDLTNSTIGIPVVRAIVPGLETFEVTNSVMGERAREDFNRFYHS